MGQSKRRLHNRFAMVGSGLVPKEALDLVLLEFACKESLQFRTAALQAHTPPFCFLKALHERVHGCPCWSAIEACEAALIQSGGVASRLRGCWQKRPAEREQRGQQDSALSPALVCNPRSCFAKKRHEATPGSCPFAFRTRGTWSSGTLCESQSSVSSCVRHGGSNSAT